MKKLVAITLCLILLIHNILADAPPEKIIAIYQAALDYRKEECGL